VRSEVLAFEGERAGIQVDEHVLDDRLLRQPETLLGLG